MGIALAARDSSLPSPYNDRQPSKLKSPLGSALPERWAPRIEFFNASASTIFMPTHGRVATSIASYPANHPKSLVIEGKFLARLK
jgi:hypothetical protein